MGYSRRSLRVIAGIVVASICSTVATAETCPFPIGSPATATSLSTLLAKAQAANLKKDEFETTASYQSRVAAASSGISSAPVTVAFPKADITKYDADSQMVTVSRYSVDASCLIFDTALSNEAKALTFGKTPKQIGSSTFGSAYCKTENVSRIPGREYEASNSYGAKVTVTSYTIKEQGLYFGYGDTGQSTFAGESNRYSADPAFAFTTTPDEARSLKANAVILYLIKPMPPFYVKGGYYAGPKFDRPTEMTITSDLLAAQPLCVAIADKATGKIFASRIMNGAQ